VSRYVNIATRVWHDEKFRELSDDAKTLFMYLLSSPHSNMCGLFYLPPPYACHDLNWSAGRYADALNKLLCKGMVFAEGDIVLIKNFLRYNPIRGPKQAVGAASRLNEIPANSLIGKFVEILKENTSAKDYQQFIDTLSIPYRYPIDTPSIPDTDTDTDTESGTESTCASDDARVCSDPQPGGSVEAEEVTATPEAKSGPRSPFKSKRQEQLFDEFWGQYPKKRSKGQAEKVWQKMCPDDELFAEILHGLSLAKTSADWQKDGGQFIPYPATWLNAKGWKDEHNTQAGGGGTTPRGWPTIGGWLNDKTEVVEQ